MFELDGITEAGRAFVFKLSLCNPFARSAGIFLLRLRFKNTSLPFFETRKIVRSKITYIFTVSSVCDLKILRCQSHIF